VIGGFIQKSCLLMNHVDYDAYREIKKKPRYWCISKALWEFSNQYSIVDKQCQSCGWMSIKCELILWPT